jgi:ABC-type nickel/cobalt efflux system permease component RcnA
MAQRSALQGILYGTFLCTLCLLIAAGIVGGLLIVLNQEISLVANQRILSIGSVVLVALPGLFLLSACASALRRDPQAAQDSTPSKLT